MGPTCTGEIWSSLASFKLGYDVREFRVVACLIDLALRDHTATPRFGECGSKISFRNRPFSRHIDDGAKRNGYGHTGDDVPVGIRYGCVVKMQNGRDGGTLSKSWRNREIDLCWVDVGQILQAERGPMAERTGGTVIPPARP